MDRLAQQEYLQSLTSQKQLFCNSLLDEISAYEQAIQELNTETTASSPVSTEPTPDLITSQSQSEHTSQNGNLLSLSKTQLVSMITRLQSQSQSQVQSNTYDSLDEISENTELQSDIQYLLHVNPSTYNNVKRYIKHMKQQSMARMSLTNANLGINSVKRYSQQIINKPQLSITNNGSVRDWHNLPRPPRRLTNVDEQKYEKDEINMLHFVVSCLNWKTEPKHRTLTEELLGNNISPIEHDLFQDFVENANTLIKHPINDKYKFTLQEILVIKLYCEENEFAQNFSKSFTMGCSSYHRSEYYQSAKIFHTIFEYKSIPIHKYKLQKLLPQNINNFGYIVKAIEIGWIYDLANPKYLVFNCSDDILMPNDTNKYDTQINQNDNDHMFIIKKFVRDIELDTNESWNKSVQFRHYAWNNIKQLLQLPFLFLPQTELNHKSLFDILFYEHKLYKMALSKTFCDRKEIQMNVYTFLFSHIHLSLNESNTAIVIDLSNANPKIHTYKPSFFKVHTRLQFSDENIVLSVKDASYASQKLQWITGDCVTVSDTDNNGNDYKSDCSEEVFDEKKSDSHSPSPISNAIDSNLTVPIPYLDSILNVNGLLKVIANVYYNKEIKKNTVKHELFEVEIEYSLSIGYRNSDDLTQTCVKTSETQGLKINFNDLMRIFYSELVFIVRSKLVTLQQRIEFCKKHKSFIILSLIYNYNYLNIRRQELIGNKSLFEYLFFECHYYELTQLFPRNHDLLLMHRYPLIEYNGHTWSVALNPMPKLVHFYENKHYFPKRIVVYVSIDVELDENSDIKWKEYFVNPALCEQKQIIIANIITESCINWNNICIKRKSALYPMILLYYKIKCEYAYVNNSVYTIESTVRTIHISTEIDMELNENESIHINEIAANDIIENKLLICDNLILHKNAKLYTSYLNIKCNKLIDIRESASIIADYRGLPGTNCQFYEESKSENINDGSKYGKGGDCYVSEYLNRSEVIFGSGGNGGILTEKDIISVPFGNEQNKEGLFHYLGTNFGTNDSYTNPFELGLVELFCGGMGSRSNKIENILNNRDCDCDCDCYFISGKYDIWFAIDLKFCRIQLTHYTLRHIDFDSNYIRNWVLEAKNVSDTHWTVVSQHSNDESIAQPKGIGVFEIDETQNETAQFYQFWRVRMIGENSFHSDSKQNKYKKKEKTWSILDLKGVFENMERNTNSFILCCAGIELFGNAILTDNYCNYARQKEQFFLLNAIQNRQFKYESDFDTNGILHWIGTECGTLAQWTNPCRSLRVCAWRGKQSEKGSVDDIVGRDTVKQCYFLDYFVIDLRDIRVLPNKYTLKWDINNRDSASNTHNWTLKASPNGQTWKAIKQHCNQVFENGCDSQTFEIHDCDHFYRYFKIENNSMLKELHCCGFEVYGMVKYQKMKYKLPALKSGGNSGGIINLTAPQIKLHNCRISVNGENGINCGGGGAAGNIFIDCDELTMDGSETKIEAIGGQGQTQVNNDGQNGRIRLFCNKILRGHTYSQACCTPKPFIL